MNNIKMLQFYLDTFKLFDINQKKSHRTIIRLGSNTKEAPRSYILKVPLFVIIFFTGFLVIEIDKIKTTPNLR